MIAMNSRLHLLSGLLLLVASLLVVRHLTAHGPSDGMPVETVQDHPEPRRTRSSDGESILKGAPPTDQPVRKASRASVSSVADVDHEEKPAVNDHTANFSAPDDAEEHVGHGEGHAVASDAERQTGIDAISEPFPASNGDSPIARAIELRRSLRKEVEQLEETSGKPVILQPAVWVDLGEGAALSPEASQGVQLIAEELKKEITESGLDPATPEYRRLWNRAVRESDWKFRARYGARAWTRHHIQAHHMAAASKSD